MLSTPVLVFIIALNAGLPVKTLMSGGALGGFDLANLFIAGFLSCHVLYNKLGRVPQ